MKKNNSVIWIALASAIFIVLLIYLFSLSKKTYDWSESYYLNDNEPFCTSVLADLLKSYFPENDFSIIKQSIDKTFDTSVTHKNYVFVGNTFHMNDSTLQNFLSFVDRGNSAFIAVRSFSDETAEKLFYTSLLSDTDETIPLAEDTGAKKSFTLGDLADEDNYITLNNIILSATAKNVNLNFTAENFAMVNGYNYIYSERDIPYAYNWKYFTQSYVEAEKPYLTSPLSKLNSGGYNFISLQHGQGTIFICTTPVILTNYFLIDKSNLDYTGKMLSYLQPGDILWDEYSKQQHGENYRRPEEAGPLQFILSQPALRWAWYTMLTSLLLFIVFRSKRTQQVIPITEPNINKSLEFVQTIGRMYYMRNDQKNLAQQKMRLFFYFLKDRYNIIITDNNEDQYEKLSMKSQVPPDDIKTLFSGYREIENKQQISNKELLQFHELLNKFYKNCK